jgi:1,4-alpha-glucan branching enzyme
MKEAIKENLPKLCRVTFSLLAPDAKEVFISGDFNGWSQDPQCRMQAHNGRWLRTFNLSPGRYHYRFVVDGRWLEDPENPLKETNPFGEMDSLLEVK